MAAVGTPIVGTMEVPGMGRSFIRDDPEGYLLTLWEPEMGRRPHPGARATSRREG
jgi:predicted enzyme related to lactoylglutathione lyase